MKTILYMTLTANGVFQQADENHPVPKEILTDFTGFIGKAGNLINGRRTYEQLISGSARNSFKGIELVIVSKQLQQTEGIHVAASPDEALQYLEQKKFDYALVAGGAQINSSFLSQDLVDEIYLNIVPALLGNDIIINMKGPMETRLKLIDTVNLSRNIVQLHYYVTHKKALN